VYINKFVNVTITV